MSSLTEVEVTCNCSSADCDWIASLDSIVDEIIPLEDFADWQCIVLPRAEDLENLAQEAAAKTTPSMTSVAVSLSINEEWSAELNDKDSPEFSAMSQNVLSKLDLTVGGTIGGLPIGSLDIIFSEEVSEARFEFFSRITVDIVVGVVTAAVNEAVDWVQNEVEEVVTEITNSQIFEIVTTGINNIVGEDIVDDGWAEVRESNPISYYFPFACDTHDDCRAAHPDGQCCRLELSLSGISSGCTHAVKLALEEQPFIPSNIPTCAILLWDDQDDEEVAPGTTQENLFDPNPHAPRAGPIGFKVRDFCSMEIFGDNNFKEPWTSYGLPSYTPVNGLLEFLGLGRIEELQLVGCKPFLWYVTALADMVVCT